MRRMRRTPLVKQPTDQLDHIDIALFIVAADVIGLTEPAAFDDPLDPAAMIFHVEPVAYIPAIAVDRYRLPGEAVPDHRRNELFGMLQGTVVVRAIGGQ